jgi:hypothetical protein
VTPEPRGNGLGPTSAEIDLDSTASRINVDTTSADSNLAELAQDEEDWDENFVVDDIFNSILHGDLQPNVRFPKSHF